MKSNRISLLACYFSLFFIFSCSNNNKVINITGTLVDASMNNISIITCDSNIISLSTMNYISNLPNGLLLGDSLMVGYVDSAKINVVKNIKVLKESPYFYIVGRWVEPINIDPSSMQGFVLNEDGTAQSVNMYTLLYKKWGMPTLDSLTLSSESIGNGTEFTSSDTYKINKLDTDSLVLSKNNYIIYRLHREP